MWKTWMQVEKNTRLKWTSIQHSSGALESSSSADYSLEKKQSQNTLKERENIFKRICPRIKNTCPFSLWHLIINKGSFCVLVLLIFPLWTTFYSESHLRYFPPNCLSADGFQIGKYNCFSGFLLHSFGNKTTKKYHNGWTGGKWSRTDLI